MAGDKIGSSSSEGSDKRTDKRNRREDGSLPLRDIRAMLGTGPSSFAHTLAELSGKLAFGTASSAEELSHQKRNIEDHYTYLNEKYEEFSKNMADLQKKLANFAEKFEQFKIGTLDQLKDNLKGLLGEMVEPHHVVDKGPANFVERASNWLSCIDEQNIYRSRRKNGRLQTILPLFGVRVKRAKRAREHSNPSNQPAKI